MGKVTAGRRRSAIRQRQKRGRKLAKLRRQYQQAKTESEKSEVLEKVGKLAPWLSPEEFLSLKRPRSL